MITWVKRFGRIDLKGDHHHWPGSSACSSHLPRPGLLQRVSLVTIKQKHLKEESKKISPHSLHCNFSIFAILHFILKYSAKVHQQLQMPRREQAEPVRRLSLASNNTMGAKKWYSRYQGWQKSQFVKLEFCISLKHHECLIREWKSSKIWSQLLIIDLIDSLSSKKPTAVHIVW